MTPETNNSPEQLPGEADVDAETAALSPPPDGALPGAVTRTRIGRFGSLATERLDLVREIQVDGIGQRPMNGSEERAVRAMVAEKKLELRRNIGRIARQK